ncbi:MAG TPA: EAL domain-containing protein [Steroidobacteraceae bacterium]|nr:EAL domain-containing protein [Steroidobacteraceae bacterium]
MNTTISPGAQRPRSARQWLPWATFGALAALVLGLGALATGRALMRSFGDVETATTEQKAEQVLRAFEADLRQLAMSNRDYAQWDDSVQFVQDHNRHYIEANLVPQTLDGMHVDLVWIVDRDGREIYSGIADRSGAPLQTPAPRADLAGLAGFMPPAHKPDFEPLNGLVATAHGLMAVAAREIQRTDQTGPTGATLLFARFIKDSDIQRMHETSQLPVKMTYLAGPDPSGARLPPAVSAWLASGDPARGTFAAADDERQITGYAVVRDNAGRPIALFSTQSPRDIVALGRHTTRIMLATILVMFVGFGAAVVWLIRRLQRSFAAQDSVELRYRNIAAQLREAIVQIDGATLEIIEANEAALQALRCTRESVDRYRVQDIFPELTPRLLTSALGRRADRSVYESRVLRADGSWVDAEINVTCLEVQGRPVLTLVAHDISHRKAAEERERETRRRLSRLAQHDALTGLPNRLYLNNRMPRVLQKIAAGNNLLALLYVDVDNFKNINDSLGHGPGDRLLQIVARRMRAAVSAHDVVARMGGDEFVIVAPLIPDRGAIDSLAFRLQTAVSAPIDLEGETVAVTASMGIAVYPADGADFDALQKHADIALYQAKEAGRNCHRFFLADMDVRISEHVALEQALRHAVGTSQIFMEYQPVIDLRTGLLSSLEALMRWRHPERGVIAPIQFIPVAEKSGLIVELGLQALTQVIAQIRAWLERDVPIVPIAVNVSPLQFDRTDFAEVVARLAAKGGVDPVWLRFEITESAMMKEPEKFIDTLKTLRGLGSQVLIDDFGTGYSSLSYLNRLPLDTLKIDRAFVRDLGVSGASTPLIHSVIDMARKLGLKTVAEGVETPEQAALLREYGCDYGQGYLFGKPVGARPCRALLRELKRVRPLTETVMVRAIAAVDRAAQTGTRTTGLRRRASSRSLD